MRTIHFRRYAAAAAIAAAPLFSIAQDVPAPQPPGLETIEESEEPAITIRKPESEREITERREDGRVTEIKVRSGKSTYYLRPNDPPGNVMRGDAMSSPVRPAEWKVHRFDRAQPEAEERDDSLEPVPATPVQPLPATPAQQQ